MTQTDLGIDEGAAVDRLLRFLAVEGVTGQEKAIGREVARHLEAAGVPRRAIRHDSAHEHIPVPTQTGNLIVTLPGTRPGPRLLFSTHLDTVPLCAGAVPVRASANRIAPLGPTALGGDNRTGCACLVTLAATLLREKLPHPPLTLLFTVREESGLWGARHLEPADLGDVTMGFNVDGGSPAEFTVGAVGSEHWEAEIRGRASHAGVYPEKGVSATLVAGLALAEVFEAGYFGKVRRRGREGTSNVGSVGGPDGKSAGEATNVVTDYACVTGESRSHDPKFMKEITGAYRDAFRRAAGRVTDDRGRPAKVKFTTHLKYHPFRLAEDSPVVRHALAAARGVGVRPALHVGNGGLDANWLVRHGIPTVTFGAGQNNIHTTQEYVDVPLFLAGCRLAMALATHGAGTALQ
jgi:tripeptide aminopeptidase